MAVAILESAQDFGDRLYRIGSGAAVDAGVQVVICALDMQLAVHNAAQPDAQGGQVRREHFRVADHRGVGMEARRPGCDVRFDVLASGLLFAFDQESHIDWKVSVVLQQAFHRLEQDVSLSFVVGGAARVEIVSAHGGLEGRRRPFVERVGRLHVVMAVEQQRRLAGSFQPLGIHQRVALLGALNQLDAVQAGPA